MKLRILAALLCLAAAAQAQTILVPATRVSVSTNGHTVITTNVLQGALLQLEQLLTNVQATATSGLASQALTTAQSATNTAAQALAIAMSSTNVAQRAYVYSLSGSFSVDSGVTSDAYFTASTQSIARIHVGQALTNAAFLAAGTTVLTVDYSTRLVTLNQALTNTATGSTGTFYHAGTYAHVTPTGFSRCVVYVTGGGGGGNVGDDEAESGGAGGTSIGYWLLIAGVSNTVTVGAAGTNAVYDTAGTGGTSSFGSLQSATGGSGGQMLADSGGVGGTAVGGAINLVGGDGDADFDRAGVFEGAPAGVSYWGGGSYGAGARVRQHDGGAQGNAGQGVVMIIYY